MEFRDQLGAIIELPHPPKRIVSLVPSQTELLIDLGADVVGRTKFCIHPAANVQNIPVIGGTKNFRLDAIRQLNPDLIIGNKEENYREGIDALKDDYPVWMSDIKSITDAVQMIMEISRIVGKGDEGASLAEKIQTGLSKIENRFSGRVIYLIWKNPWMAAGADTFICSMLSHIGFENAVENDRYPELSHQDLQSLDADFIFLSSEPFPFGEEHLREIQTFTASEVFLVDGEMFSWYGSRMLRAINYFKQASWQQKPSSQ